MDFVSLASLHFLLSTNAHMGQLRFRSPYEYLLSCSLLRYVSRNDLKNRIENIIIKSKSKTLLSFYCTKLMFINFGNLTGLCQVRYSSKFLLPAFQHCQDILFVNLVISIGSILFLIRQCIVNSCIRAKRYTQSQPYH